MHVELDQVGHRFDRSAWLFHDLSHSLHPDRLYALTGPSGSGKSTLLSIISGHVNPAAGRVRRIGVSRVQWVFQNPFGDPRRSVLDLVCLPLLSLGMLRRDARIAAATLLAEFGLAEHAMSRFSTLSGGQAQRLMLARAISAQPDLLLVDEPTAQLDSQTAETVIGALGRLVSRGAIVVVATHDERTVRACTDSIELVRSTR